MLGRRTTYASDIDRVGQQQIGARWGGVLARDTMPAPGDMSYYIVNTDVDASPEQVGVLAVNGETLIPEPEPEPELIP